MVRERCNQLCSRPVTGSCKYCDILDEADRFIWTWIYGGWLWEVFALSRPNTTRKAVIWLTTKLWRFIRFPFQADIFRAIELIAILVAVTAFLLDYRNRHEERESRAWQSLTTDAPGNSGMIEALEYLNRQAPCLLANRRLFLKNWNELGSFLDSAGTLRSRFDLGTNINPPGKSETNTQWDFITRGLWFERIDATTFVSVKREETHECVFEEIDPLFFWCYPNWWPFRKERTSMEGIDLTPPAVDAQWQPLSNRFLPNMACPQNTYLQNADLACARFKGATFVCSDLQDADLQETDLRKADLRHVNLKAANLRRANLKQADLRGAQLDDFPCLQIRQATNWKQAYRDESLACGEKIPNPARINRP